MSRNPHVPTKATRQEVRLLSARWMRQWEIALMLDISEKTLRLYYRRELDDGRADVIAAVTEALLKLIKMGNDAAAIFYYKCQGGKRTDGDRAWYAEMSQPEKYAKLVEHIAKPPPIVVLDMKKKVMADLLGGCPLETVGDAALLRAIAQCEEEIAAAEDCDDVKFFAV